MDMAQKISKDILAIGGVIYKLVFFFLSQIIKKNMKDCYI